MQIPGLRLRGGRYRLLSEIGRGASSIVWRALDMQRAEACALKALPLVSGGAESAALEIEARVRIGHPGALAVRDHFREEEAEWLVFDLAAASLLDVVEPGGLDADGQPVAEPLAVPAALHVARALCDVLAAAHAAGVVHRDVKPANVLLLEEGAVRLTDFGIARIWADPQTRTRTGAILGTLPWMAPEQRHDPRAVRPATDVYAIAATLAWMLLGRAPAELYVPAAVAQLRAADVPEPLIGAIVQAGAWSPEERPDARTFSAALAALQTGAEAEAGASGRDLLRTRVAARAGRLAGVSDPEGTDAQWREALRHVVEAWATWESTRAAESAPAAPAHPAPPAPEPVARPRAVGVRWLAVGVVLGGVLTWIALGLGTG